LFEFVTSTVIGDTQEAESAALDSIMEHVDSSATKLEKATDHERRALNQQESVDEAVFMSQFLPRSLNQVADYEIKKIQDGDVEETYAHAVAALTGNEDVVSKVAEVTGVDSKSTHVLFANEVDVIESDDEWANPAVSDSGEGSEMEEEEAGDESDDDGSHTFVKKVMTPEDVAAAKEAQRAMRKENKKAVKEANLEKRKTKIKKKDKKRAINKTKGNKKK
jgi:RIO kinase 1